MPEAIILDCDPGVDDALAILLAHRHPQINLIGLTTVFGNAPIEAVTRNARLLKKRYGFDAPIAQGAGSALQLETHYWPTIVHGHDGLGDVRDAAFAYSDLPKIDPRPAHQMMIDMARAHPGEITIVAVGRMTNLASALIVEPDLAKLVKKIVIMGGAFALEGHNGNVTPVAEANIIGDPHAADIVFGGHWPVQIAGLDVTRKTVLSRSDFAALSVGDEACQFVAALSQGYIDYHQRFGIDGCWVHDSSAVALALAPSLFDMRAGPIRVATEGVAIGQTIQRDPSLVYPPGDWDGRPDQEVAVGVDSAAVRSMILETLLR